MLFLYPFLIAKYFVEQGQQTLSIKGQTVKIIRLCRPHSHFRTTELNPSAKAAIEMREGVLQ